VEAELAQAELLCQLGRQRIRAGCGGHVGMKGRIEDGVLRDSRQAVQADVYNAERVGLWMGASGAVRRRAGKVVSSMCVRCS